MFENVHHFTLGYSYMYMYKNVLKSSNMHPENDYKVYTRFTLLKSWIGIFRTCRKLGFLQLFSVYK